MKKFRVKTRRDGLAVLQHRVPFLVILTRWADFAIGPRDDIRRLCTRMASLPSDNRSSGSRPVQSARSA